MNGKSVKNIGKIIIICNFEK